METTTFHMHDRPDAPTHPTKPTHLRARSGWDALKRSVSKGRRSDLGDRAAALTYYGLLALFPAVLVVVALIGIFGEYPRTTNSLLDIVNRIAPKSTVRQLREPIEGVVRSKGGAGALLGVGLLAALWSASGYVGAFIKTSNAIYGVEEGRKFWVLRPLQLAITVALVVGAAIVAIAVVITGPLARAIGDEIGVGDEAVKIWGIAKWPVLAFLVVTGISLLYYAAPNIRVRGFRWVTPGALLALATWLIASMGFGLYVANFGSYNETYGALGGIVIFLVWMWIGNLAIVLGTQFDAELERSRELEHGIPGAEDAIQLPPRKTKTDASRRSA